MLSIVAVTLLVTIALIETTHFFLNGFQRMLEVSPVIEVRGIMLCQRTPSGEANMDRLSAVGLMFESLYRCEAFEVSWSSQTCTNKDSVAWAHGNV